MKPLLAVFTVFALLAFPLEAYPRTWTDATGKYKIEAELVEVKGKDVVLKKSNGSTVTVPISKLSKADQEFLAKRSRPKAEPKVEPKTPAGPPKEGQVVKWEGHCLTLSKGFKDSRRLTFEIDGKKWGLKEDVVVVEFRKGQPVDSILGNKKVKFAGKLNGFTTTMSIKVVSGKFVAYDKKVPFITDAVIESRGIPDSGTPKKKRTGRQR